MKRCLGCDVRTDAVLVAADVRRKGRDVACCATCQADLDRLLLVAAHARACCWRKSF
jgi:hypothetical protein